MSRINNLNIANDVQAVGGLRQLAQKDKEQAIKALAREFEAMMLRQLLKSSREVSWDDGFGEGMPGTGSMESYREWRDEQMAQNLSAQGSMGFADMLVKQLMPQPQPPQPKRVLLTMKGAQKTMVEVAQQVPKSTQSSGWWRVPEQADVTIPTVPMSEVAVPTTAEALLLHNMLQGKLK
jgi:flagellar protein FlgJ